jgi:hypothetical protein
MKTHTYERRGPLQIWTPTPEYLAWLDREHPRMTVDEMRGRGYLKKEGAGVRQRKWLPAAKP